MKKITPFELFKEDTNRLYCKIIAPIEILLFWVDYGFESNNETGYAHLIEHLFISANKQYLECLDSKMIHYNACTESDYTSYTFINLNNTSILTKEYSSLKNIFKVSITKDLISTEKKVIIEEFGILSNSVGNEVASKMIGNPEMINAFNISTVESRIQGHYQTIKSIAYTDVPNNCFADEVAQSWQDEVKLLEKTFIDDKTILKLENNHQARILKFFIHIVDVIKSKNYECLTDNNNDHITLSLEHGLSYDMKIKLLTRYGLMCSDFKFLLQETTILAKHQLWYNNLFEIFLTDWNNIYE